MCGFMIEWVTLILLELNLPITCMSHHVEDKSAGVPGWVLCDGDMIKLVIKCTDVYNSSPDCCRSRLAVATTAETAK